MALIAGSTACTTLRAARSPLPDNARVEVTMRPPHPVSVVNGRGDTTKVADVRVVKGRVDTLLPDALVLTSATLRSMTRGTVRLVPGQRAVVPRGPSISVEERRFSVLETVGLTLGIISATVVTLIVVLLLTWDCGAC